MSSRSMKDISKSTWSVLITCSLMRKPTYVEEELAVDNLSSGGLREVAAKKVVVEGHLLELLRVELFVPRNCHRAKLFVRDQLFLAT